MQLYQLYQQLLQNLGHQGPWPGETKEEIIAGAILVQNTRWENVEYSLNNLRRYLDSDFRRLSQVPPQALQDLIRPSGFYKNKSRALQEIFRWLVLYGFDYDQIASHYRQNLRQQLLSLFGIGQETADVLLLYAFDQPVFIADKYAQKLFSQLTEQGFSDYRSLCQAVPALTGFTLEEAQQFHILIDEFGKRCFRDGLAYEQTFLKDFSLQLILKENQSITSR